MAELVSLKDMSVKEKVMLLKALNFSSDGVYVLNNKGERVYDKYIEVPVKISNMAILPGSTIILDDNPLSIASYLEEYKEAI
jgi:hypothetical protein